MQKLFAVVVVLGVIGLGVIRFGDAPALASSSWYGTLNSNCRNCAHAVRFFPNNDPGTLVRTVRVAVSWETRARLMAHLFCGGQSGRVDKNLATSHGEDGFLSLTVGVPNFYPRCEVWVQRYSGPTTRYVMNVFGRNARAGTFLRPPDAAAREAALSEAIDSARRDEETFRASDDQR